MKSISHITSLLISRSVIQFLLAPLVIIYVSVGLLGCSQKNKNSIQKLSKESHPNVLLLIVDDLKPLLGAYGETQILTPNIDSLSSISTVFTNAHSQQAICAPSRVSFLTGMRPDYTQVWGLKTLMSEELDLLTLPAHFTNSGYETVGLGKVFHNREDNDPNFWTRKFINSKNLEFSSDYPVPVFQRKYQNKKSQKAFKNHVSRLTYGAKEMMRRAGALPSVENEDVPDDAYIDGAVTTKSIQLMKRLKKKEAPFFMTIGFRKPHLPFVAPRKYWDLYKREEIEVAQFQKRAEGSPSFAYHSNGELRTYSDIPQDIKSGGLLNEEKQRELIHGYYACVSYIDAQIGLIMEYLKKSGLEKNTVVVLMGDHGWHLGDHGIWNKHTNFEQATRTPLIIHSPEIKSGTSNSSPVELLDVFPTLCDLSGIEKPKHLQGISLLPILKNERERVKPFALSQYPKGKYMGYAVRTDRYRYVEWHNKEAVIKGIYKEQNINAIELYDYEVDPLETRNLIEEEDYVQIRADLKNKLKKSIVSNKKIVTPQELVSKKE